MFSNNVPPPFASLLAEEAQLLCQIQQGEHTLDRARRHAARLRNPATRSPDPPGTLPAVRVSPQERCNEQQEFIRLLTLRLNTAINQLAVVRAALRHHSCS
ncbi:MAG: hypothetical protein H0X24_06185 [Ktedonobacterales bacterium]|nr:hypothetical protein [Ktedonobacterales bacterium]